MFNFLPGWSGVGRGPKRAECSNFARRWSIPANFLKRRRSTGRAWATISISSAERNPDAVSSSWSSSPAALAGWRSLLPDGDDRRLGGREVDLSSARSPRPRKACAAGVLVGRDAGLSIVRCSSRRIFGVLSTFREFPAAWVETSPYSSYTGLA